MGKAGNSPWVFVSVSRENNTLNFGGSTQHSPCFSGSAFLIKLPSPDFVSSEEMSWDIASSFTEVHLLYI